MALPPRPCFQHCGIAKESPSGVQPDLNGYATVRSILTVESMYKQVKEHQAPVTGRVSAQQGPYQPSWSRSRRCRPCTPRPLPTGAEPEPASARIRLAHSLGIYKSDRTYPSNRYQIPFKRSSPGIPLNLAISCAIRVTGRARRPAAGPAERNSGNSTRDHFYGGSCNG